MQLTNLRTNPSYVTLIQFIEMIFAKVFWSLQNQRKPSFKNIKREKNCFKISEIQFQTQRNTVHRVYETLFVCLYVCLLFCLFLHIFTFVCLHSALYLPPSVVTKAFHCNCSFCGYTIPDLEPERWGNLPLHLDF